VSDAPRPELERRPLSALPSRLARTLGFVAILVAGGAGGLIGWALVDVQCSGACTTPTSIGGVTGALVAAGGTAVVVVLGLRAMGEWRELQDRRK
jgi:hypothetical protein